MNAITIRSTTSPELINGTVLDTRLAGALGYERPTDFRKLIKRHLPILEAMGLVRQVGAPIVSGKGRVSMVTEYHLNRAQAAFLIAKAGTKLADSLTVKMAEVFAMFGEGKLVGVDKEAEAELGAIAEREHQRRLAIRAEEKAARSSGFAALRGR